MFTRPDFQIIEHDALPADTEIRLGNALKFFMAVKGGRNDFYFRINADVGAGGFWAKLSEAVRRKRLVWNAFFLLSRAKMYFQLLVQLPVL